MQPLVSYPEYQTRRRFLHFLRFLDFFVSGDARPASPVSCRHVRPTLSVFLLTRPSDVVRFLLARPSDAVRFLVDTAVRRCPFPVDTSVRRCPLPLTRPSDAVRFPLTGPSDVVRSPVGPYAQLMFPFPFPFRSRSRSVPTPALVLEPTRELWNPAAARRRYNDYHLKIHTRK